MKKIIFLYQSLEIGGAENLRLALLRNIDKAKFDIKVCSLSNKGLIGEKIERLGYKVDVLGQNPDSKNIIITHRLLRYLRKERPDILHSCLFNANFHGRIAGLFSRVPFLITEEHSEHFQYNGFKMLPYKIADFILARITNFIVCCSEGLRKDIIRKEKLPAQKVITIENCIDLERYKISIHKDEIRRKHNIKDEFVFINVACFSGRKGHIFLIEALRDIKEMGYNFKCFFAGDGPIKEALRNKCCELGLSKEVIFLGTVDNVVDYLNASDAFVLPSLFEGLSIALIEAMFMELPCIVTDVGSNTDLIKTGFNGTVVAPKDKEGLKNAIIFYLKNKDLIKEYGRRSMGIVEAKYSSIDAYTRKFHELWDKCVDNE
jgi:glycosyltransferase involved in cell wall biosynthesis